jgi:hypothetical protein
MAVGRRHATVVVIDAFDHPGYADPPLPFHTAAHPGTRTSLKANYAATRRRRQDRRRGAPTLEMRQYTSASVERYQHLLLGTHPIVDDAFDGGPSPVEHAGYSVRRLEAESRYADWEFEEDPVQYGAPLGKSQHTQHTQRPVVPPFPGTFRRLLTFAVVRRGAARSYGFAIGAPATNDRAWIQQPRTTVHV